jgi:tRNA splicing endonuclease
MSDESTEERRRRADREQREKRQQREEQEERREEQELRRSALRKIAGYLGFADLMAVLMVAATGFSAFATWRTATIAYELLMSSERPYFGVEDVKLDRSRLDDPRIFVDYRNFGHIPADGVKLKATMFIYSRPLPADGKPVAVNGVSSNAGILSPDVPHHVFLHIPKERYADVMAGRESLLTQVSAWYTNSGGRVFCYRERFTYMPDSDTFEIAGGSSRCDSPPPATPQRAGAE